MSTSGLFPWLGACLKQRENRAITVAIWFHTLLLVCSILALPFDHRVILGLNPWIKPIKFDISTIIFLVTAGLLLHTLGESGHWRRMRILLAWGFSLAMVFENSLISMQSARGVPSHMNYTSPFNAIAFSMMGLWIAVNTILLGILLVLFVRTTLERPSAEIWGIRLGLAMVLLASFEGVRMVIFGSHTVGAEDGGPGLPFINWSTQHGDLRIAHFFALHAFQIFWLVGAWLGRTRLPQAVSIAGTWAFSLLYATGVWLLFTQAMAAHPLIAMH